MLRKIHLFVEQWPRQNHQFPEQIWTRACPDPWP